MKNKITVSAPGKLMLFGEHAVVYGHPCIVTAMDQRMRVTVEKTSGQPGSIMINAPDLGQENFVFSFQDQRKIEEFPKEVRFLVALLRRIGPDVFRSGYMIATKSEFSHLFGFGSSSAVTVATAAALNTSLSLQLDKKKLFDVCYQAVLDVQKVGSGFDLAAAIWGETLFFFPGGKQIEPLRLSNLPLTVVYTGIKADTVTLVKEVARLRDKDVQISDRIFSEITSIVHLAHSALQEKQWKLVGALMDQNHELLIGLNVSSPEIEIQRQNLLACGAFGAKLSGAGGGDCVIGIGPVDHGKLAVLAKNSGGSVMNVEPNAPGVKEEI